VYNVHQGCSLTNVAILRVSLTFIGLKVTLEVSPSVYFTETVDFRFFPAGAALQFLGRTMNLPADSSDYRRSGFGHRAIELLRIPEI
jgi:hypothetical protein